MPCWHFTLSRSVPLFFFFFSDTVQSSFSPLPPTAYIVLINLHFFFLFPSLLFFFFSSFPSLPLSPFCRFFFLLNCYLISSLPPSLPSTIAFTPSFHSFTHIHSSHNTHYFNLFYSIHSNQHLLPSYHRNSNTTYTKASTSYATYATTTPTTNHHKATQARGTSIDTTTHYTNKAAQHKDRHEHPLFKQLSAFFYFS